MKDNNNTIYHDLHIGAYIGEKDFFDETMENLKIYEHNYVLTLPVG